MFKEARSPQAVILATDTSTKYCSVSICRASLEGSGDFQILAETIVDRHRLHSERLISTVDWILGEANMSLKDVTALALSNGPGSFTGLRIANAAWKGFALSCGLPLVPVSTLDAMTLLGGWGNNAMVVPMLDARMSEVFGAVYSFKNGLRVRLTDEMVCSVEALMDCLPQNGERNIFVLGDGAQRFRKELLSILPNAIFMSPLCSIPRASAVAAEAAAMIAAGYEGNPGAVSPVYLRQSQAEMNRDAKDSLSEAGA